MSTLALDTPPQKKLALEYMTSLLALKDALQTDRSESAVGRRIFHSHLAEGAASNLAALASSDAQSETRSNVEAAAAVSTTRSAAEVVTELTVRHRKLACFFTFFFFSFFF